jgi:quinol-cytochrome oxidoreductase complex cytochrome b subunit
MRRGFTPTISWSFSLPPSSSLNWPSSSRFSIPSIGRQIDFSAQYQPRPEWYFLWIYQLVRYFPGRTAFVGTVLLPIVAVLALILIPFLDRGERGRLKALLVGITLALLFVVFTFAAVLSL